MRLSCEQEDLHRGLSAVARAIPARTTLPITQHVLFEALEDSIRGAGFEGRQVTA